MSEGRVFENDGELVEGFAVLLDRAEKRVEPDEYHSVIFKIFSDILKSSQTPDKVVAAHDDDMERYGMVHGVKERDDLIGGKVIGEGDEGRGSVVDDEVLILTTGHDKLDESVELGFLNIGSFHNIEAFRIEGLIFDKGWGNGVTVDARDVCAQTDEILSSDVGEQGFSRTAFGVQEKMYMSHLENSF